MCDKLTFPGFYDLVVIVDHQMHHARHGRYRGWMSETGTRVLHISDGGENRVQCAFVYFVFLSHVIKRLYKVHTPTNAFFIESDKVLKIYVKITLTCC